MKIIPVILMGIVTVGIGDYAAFGKGVRPPAGAASSAPSGAAPGSDKPSRSDNETAALRAGVARLHAEVAALREQMAATQGSARADADADDPGPAPRDPAEIAQRKREWHAHMADVASRFQREAMDPGWAPSTLSAVRSALSSNDAMRDKVRDVECRSQTCRVELADDGSAAMSKDLPLFVHQLAGVLPSVQADHVDEGDQRSALVLYMTRRERAPSLD
jgi:hypothetical protein